MQTTPLSRLIGTWKTNGKIFNGSEITYLDGTDTYEWTLGERFVLHRANVTMGGAASETLEMISKADAEGRLHMQYFNSNGESGQMTGSITGNDFHIDGQGLKFRGTLNDESTEINGTWYLHSPAGVWEVFILLKLEKIG